MSGPWGVGWLGGQRGQRHRAILVFVDWRLDRSNIRHDTGRKLIYAAAGVFLMMVAACSGTTTRIAEPGDVADVEVTSTTSTSTTTTSTTTTTIAPNPGMAASVAFLDACVSGDGLTGPCHCALSALATAVPADQWAIMEDRLQVDGRFPEVMGEALVACREAPEPALDVAAIDPLVQSCVDAGTDRAVCRCAGIRAWQIVPVALLGDYANDSAAVPSFADLVDACRI